MTWYKTEILKCNNCDKEVSMRIPTEEPMQFEEMYDPVGFCYAYRESNYAWVLHFCSTCTPLMEQDPDVRITYKPTNPAPQEVCDECE